MENIMDDKKAFDLLINYYLEIDNGDILSISGECGTGKTTLACRIAQGLCEQGKKVLYISTDYTENQIFKKVGELKYPSNLKVYLEGVCFKRIDGIIKLIEGFLDSFYPDLLIIDDTSLLFPRERKCMARKLKVLKSNIQLPIIVANRFPRKSSEQVRELFLENLCYNGDSKL